MDFTQSFLQGVQQGQQRAAAKQREEREAEEFDLKKQMLKVEMQKLDIAQKVAARQSAFQEAENQSKFDAPTVGPGMSTGMPTLDFAASQPPDVVPKNIPEGGYGEPATTVMAPTRTGIQNTALDQFNRLKAAEIDKAKATVEAQNKNRVATAEAVAAAQAKNRPTPQPTTASLALLAAQGNKEAASALGLIKASTGGRGGGTEAVVLTPEGEAMAALQFKKTGKLPPLGFDARTKTKIINRAASLTPAEIAALEAGGLDLASNMMDFAADKGSLTTLQRTRDAITAFEKTAIRNIDIFLGIAKNAVDSGSPLINRPVRSIAGTLLGSTDIAKFNAARQVALVEAAKVLNNPNLSGVLSDSARKEVEQLLLPSATLGQAYEVLSLLKNEMKGRTQYLDETIAEIKERGKEVVQPPPGATAPKRQKALGPDGKIVEFELIGSQWVPVKQ